MEGREARLVLGKVEARLLQHRWMKRCIRCQVVMVTHQKEIIVRVLRES